MIMLERVYLRFGEIPQGEKSIDFIKLSLDDNSDFSYFLSIGNINAAYNCIPSNCYEKGVSVFELDEDRKPILNNENLKRDYEFRVNRGDKMLFVTGEEVGRGRSGEPLIINIKEIKE